MNMPTILCSTHFQKLEKERNKPSEILVAFYTKLWSKTINSNHTNQLCLKNTVEVDFEVLLALFSVSISKSNKTPFISGK